MATMLSDEGYEVGIYDADFDLRFVNETGITSYYESFRSQNRVRDGLFNSNHEIWQECRETLRRFRPDIVGITAMTSKFPMVTKIAEIIREEVPQASVFIGGHHATIFGRELLENRDFDFAVVGEGEYTVMELVHALTWKGNGDLSLIKGLIYRDGGEVVETPSRALIDNLDELPIANRDLIINPGYPAENNMIISRGCPYNCHYCGAKLIWTHRVRRRSVANVMKEIEYLLSRNKSKHISFWDDSFTCNQKYTRELLVELRKHKGLRFSCITRLDLINPDLLSEMKASGCAQILFGIESGSDQILKLIDKKLNIEQIKKQTAVVNAADIPWLGFFIIGYPGERKEDILKTVKFMKELHPYWAEVNIFNPLPGTEIWDRLESMGHVSSRMDFSKNSQISTEHCFVEDMNTEEFRKLALDVAIEFDKNNSRQRFHRRIKKCISKIKTLINRG